MGFLTFVFFLLFGLYIFGLVLKLVFRVWISRKARQFQQGPGARTSARSGRTPKPEGAVTVEQTAPRNKRVSKHVGDYVEFEEVQEK